MPQQINWAPPHNKDIHGAFHYVDDVVCAVGDSAPDPDVAAAGQASLAAWNAVQALPDAAFMILKSPGHQSLAFRNGGIVVEGAHNLNAGLLRSSTKALEQAPSPLQAHKELASNDRFRRLFWAVMTRLAGAVVPRSMKFNLAGTTGTIHASQGKISLSGDFETIRDFVAEVRAASQIEDVFSYTLVEPTAHDGRAEFPINAVLDQVFAPSDAGTCTFDAQGWPTARTGQAQFGDLQVMHDFLCAIENHPAHSGETSISVLSHSNATLLKGTRSADGNACFQLSLRDAVHAARQ